MATLETAARSGELPGVDAAMRAGELSAVRRPPPDDDTGTVAERQARICDAAIARIEEYVATKRARVGGR